MALFWQEDGKMLIHNPYMYLIVSYNWIYWYKTSKESGDHVLLMDVSLPQDVADFEWIMWFNTFRNHILFALVGHVIFAKIFTLVAPKVRVCVCDCLWDSTVFCMSILSM